MYKKYLIHISAGILAFLLIIGIVLYVSSGTFLRKAAERGGDDTGLFESIPASIALFPLQACFKSFPCISALQYSFLYALVSSFETYAGDVYECATPSGLKLFLPKSLMKERGSCKLIWHNKARVIEEEKQDIKQEFQEISYNKLEFSISDNRVLFDYPKEASIKIHEGGKAVSFSLNSENEKEVKEIFFTFGSDAMDAKTYTKKEIPKFLERGWVKQNPYQLKTGVQIDGYATDLRAHPEPGSTNCTINYQYVMPIMNNGKEQTGILSFQATHRHKEELSSPTGDTLMSWCTLYQDEQYSYYKNMLSHILSTLE